MPNPNLPIAGNYNTYIGARYVPLIMGQWSETVAYEPLSVVTYQGNSYTSKTFVPAGTPVTNETYWANTGNYNAQVEQYRQEVLTYSQTVESYHTEVNQYITVLGDVQEQIKIINGNGPILFIGDSYTNVPNNFIKKTMEMLNITNYTLIPTSGAGFNTTNPLSYFNILTQWLANNTARDFIAVYCLGGRNDFGGGTNVTLGINQTLSLIKSSFPKAKIYIGMYGVDKPQSGNVLETNRIYREGANANGAEFIPNMTSPLVLGNKIQSDGIHPNDAGQNALTQFFTNYLLSHNTSFFEYLGLTGLFLNTGINSDGSFAINRNGNITALISLSVSTPGTFIGNINLGKQQLFYIPNIPTIFPMQVVFVTSTGNVVDYGIGNFSGDELTFYAGQLNNIEYTSFTLYGEALFTSYVV